MDTQQRSSLVLGLLLVLLGGLFLAFQVFPALRGIIRITYSWPLIVIAAGLFLLILGPLVRAPGMAVPAAIVMGVGGILYWQNTTGAWESWAYIWSLIPGFAGIGVILASLLGDKGAKAGDGINLIIISLIMFAIFGSFLGNLGLFGAYWPVLLILLGFWLLVQAFFRRRRAA